MQFSEKRTTIRWIIIITSFVIVSMILWNTYSFFQRFKEDERLKMELWAQAQITVNNSLDEDVTLPLKIISNTNVEFIERAGCIQLLKRHTGIGIHCFPEKWNE